MKIGRLPHLARDAIRKGTGIASEQLAMDRSSSTVASGSVLLPGCFAQVAMTSVLLSPTSRSAMVCSWLLKDPLVVEST